MMRSIAYISFFMLALSGGLLGQFSIEHLEERVSSLEDIYKLQLKSQSVDPHIAFFEVELFEGNQLLYKARTNNVNIIQPLTNFNQIQLSPIQELRNEVGRLSGSYNLTVKLIDARSMQILHTERILIQAALKENQDTEASIRTKESFPPGRPYRKGCPLWANGQPAGQFYRNPSKSVQGGVVPHGKHRGHPCWPGCILFHRTKRIPPVDEPGVAAF
jgi:hypothetical protein